MRRHLTARDDERTRLLSRALTAAKRRGYLTKGELVAVCRWKSARVIGRVRANTHHRIREATSTALSARNEQRRVDALVELEGVSVPMASAVLMLLYPKRYGVIDIRVWQLLHAARAVDHNPKGTRLTTAHWLQFLSVIRRLALRLHVSPRATERGLFAVHKAHQHKRLYG